MASLQENGAIPSFAEAESLLVLRDYLGTNPELGEYKIILEEFDYQVCGQETRTVTEECCQVNFTITEPYLIQEGLSASQDHNSHFYSTNNYLTSYTRMDGSTFADIIEPDVIDVNDYDGGTAVARAVDVFVEKYHGLALGDGNRQKVPGRNIFVLTDGRISSDDIVDIV